MKAHDAVSKALASGALERGPCEVCGASEVVAHHDDYDAPLTVRWLCTQHHADWHTVNGPAKNRDKHLLLERMQKRGYKVRDRLDMKVPGEQVAQWRKVAAEEGVTLSQWLRRLANAEIRRLQRRKK